MAAILAAALAAGTIAPSAAQASIGQCGSGMACLWQDLNYTGGFVQDSSWIKMGLVWNNLATSVASYGNTNCARFWDDTGFTGAYIYFSRPARGGTYRDPDLRNGGGYGPHRTENWNDRIGSQNWQKCPRV